jgi:hypothetical protein
MVSPDANSGGGFALCKRGNRSTANDLQRDEKG